MSSLTEPVSVADTFMRKSTVVMGLSGMLLLMPLAINNLWQGQIVIGGLGMVVVVVLALVALDAARNGHRYPLMVMVGLLPLVTLSLSVSMHRQGWVGLLWCYPAVMAFYTVLRERRAWLANAAILLVTIPTIWIVFPVNLAVRGTVTLTLVSVFSFIFARANDKQQEALRRIATVDSLTGLGNRMLLSSVLDRVVHALPLERSMVLVTLDLDHFKRVNDDRGHDAGDQALREVGIQLREHFRPDDHLFRVGGEEFLVVLEDVSLESARHAAERFRQLIEAHPLLHEFGVTVSAGVARREPGDDTAAWLKRGDEHLYKAKQGGRNQVMG